MIKRSLYHLDESITLGLWAYVGVIMIIKLMVDYLWSMFFLISYLELRFTQKKQPES